MTRADRFGIELHSPKVKSLLQAGRDDPERVWERMARRLNWFEPWDIVYENEGPDSFRWFVGGRTNLSYNCLDFHVENGRGNRTALIYEPGEREQTRVLTYAQLLHEVNRFASVLRGFGIERGDPVTIYMPTSIEAIVAMLACTRIGAVHSVIFAGFGAEALADRIELAGSSLLVTADVSYRGGETIDLMKIVDQCLAGSTDASSRIHDVLVQQRSPNDPRPIDGRYTSWTTALEESLGHDEYVEMNANEPAFILPTSGTTGQPKGAMHTHGGYQVHVFAMSKWMYDLCASDVWFATSDIGWIVGHSYSVYGPLLCGATSVIFEGVPTFPDPGVWWEIVDRNKVSKIVTSPTAIRELSGHPNKHHERYDLGSIELIVSGGEPLNPGAWQWLQKEVLNDAAPVVDHMWQTETAGPIVGNPYGIDLLPIKPGSAGIPLPGIHAVVVDDAGTPVGPDIEGKLVIERPFPGLIPTLWEGSTRYEREYWQQIDGVYWVGDAASMDEDGYLWFRGRADELLTISGHRIGPAEIENALVSHEAVVKAGVVGKPHPKKTEVAAAFVVPHSNYEVSPSLRSELIERVRTDVGPIADVRELEFVDKIPKNRAGKIMRRTIRDIILGESPGDASMLVDESAVEVIEAACEQFEQESYWDGSIIPRQRDD